MIKNLNSKYYISPFDCELAKMGITHTEGYQLTENHVELDGQQLTLVQSNGAKRIYRQNSIQQTNPLRIVRECPKVS